MRSILVPPPIKAALQAGADVAISVSGGKDSDAMAIAVTRFMRRAKYTGRVHLIFADLGRGEWPHSRSHVRRLAQRLALPLTVVKRPQGDVVDRWWQRYHKLKSEGRDIPHWSSPRWRFCTSDLKVNPIDKHLRRWCPTGTVICAVGLRAEESPARAKKPVYKARTAITTQKRTGWTWHPILNFSIDDVWETIGTSSAKVAKLRQAVAEVRERGDDVWDYIRQLDWPANPVYLIGNTRLSCALCIMASMNDLHNGIAYNVELYRELVEMELQSGFSFQHKRWLADLRPDLLTPEMRARRVALRASETTPTPAPSPTSQPCQLPLF